MIEWGITVLIVIPALFLAVVGSSWLLDYAIIVLAFNRCIRRIVDYYVNGQFNPLSPISLTPLVVAVLFSIPVLVHIHRLPRRSRLPFYLFSGAIAIGFGVGVVQNRFAAIYSLAEWMAGLGAMAFAAAQPANSKVADRWIKTAGWCAVAVAAYGWWQYYTIPPWDGMWLIQSGMMGYMGFPEPTMMTVFSTLNERGPCGGFLAWAAIPMIINPRWRNAGGWFSVILLLSGIVLTSTRSNLIVIVIVAVLYPALSKGRGIGRLLVLACIILGSATWGLNRIPEMEKMSNRFQSESLYGKDSSLRGRLEIYRSAAGGIVSNPLGRGLGSSGMGQRAESKTLETIGDSGYLQIFSQFGLLGTMLFFYALLLLWRELGRRWKVGCKLFGPEGVDDFVPATRAILLSSLVYLYVGDIFSGFSLLWIFFGRVLSPSADPVRVWERRKVCEEQAVSGGIAENEGDALMDIASR